MKSILLAIYLSLQSNAEAVIQNAQDNPSLYMAILVIIYEIFVRLKPTKRNLSILAAIEKLIPYIDMLIPNKRKEK